MKNAKNSLGERMKTFYEKVTKYILPKKTYTIIRVDGKAFHTYTLGLEEPFDMQFVADMDATACYMCENIQGAKLAFVQSDEISIVVTDFDQLETQSWFGNSVQKIASVSASLATAKFNELRYKNAIKNMFAKFKLGNDVTYETFIQNINISFNKIALFDSRAFTIPTATEVINYLIWRQQDTVRNSISSVAQNIYSTTELKGKNCNDMQEMCFEKGINWNDFDPKLKRGRLIIKETFEKDGTIRSKWVSTVPTTFTKDQELLRKVIPVNQ